MVYAEIKAYYYIGAKYCLTMSDQQRSFRNKERSTTSNVKLLRAQASTEMDPGLKNRDQDIV